MTSKGASQGCAFATVRGTHICRLTTTAVLKQGMKFLTSLTDTMNPCKIGHSKTGMARICGIRVFFEVARIQRTSVSYKAVSLSKGLNRKAFIELLEVTA